MPQEVLCSLLFYSPGVSHTPSKRSKGFREQHRQVKYYLGNFHVAL